MKDTKQPTIKELIAQCEKKEITQKEFLIELSRRPEADVLAECKTKAERIIAKNALKLARRILK